ncbi:MAG: response regulator [Bryobacterales bacterium]|nr:response regulator [Bryobacterales bacterium]
MSRVLLADDSPHAQRMGERILREEGFEVLSVTDGEAALSQLTEFDPDLLLADAFLPRRSGFDICREIKGNPKLKHVRVILTAGVLEPLDETEAARAGSDGLLKKPFEASAVLETIKPLLESARQDRELQEVAMKAAAPAVAVAVAENPLRILQPEAAAATPAPAAPRPEPEISDEQVRAAVTLAVDAAMPVLVEEITRQVLQALKK